MKFQKKKRMVITLALTITLVSNLAPAMTVNQSSLLTWRPFLRSLHPKKGVYYLVSPEIIQMPSSLHSIGDIDGRYKQFELRADYIIIYGENEKIASRIELAKENMASIRSELAASLKKLDPTPLTVAGVLNLGDEYKATANGVCGLNIVVPPDRLTGAMVGDRLSEPHICIGFGIIAGMAGYRITRGEHTLELRRVIDVTQGAQIDRDPAPGGRHPNHMPVTGAQKQQST